MNKILDTAAEILETKTFEDLSVSEIVKKAGTSVGAFYGRFKDKDALLHALDERFFREFERRLKDVMVLHNWGSRSLSGIVEDTLGFIADLYSSDRGVIRSLSLKARIHGDPRFMERERKAWTELLPLFVEHMLRHRGKIKHPDPESAIPLGFQMMFFSLKEILLWEPLRTETEPDTEYLIAELSRAYLAYLGVKPPKPRVSPGGG